MFTGFNPRAVGLTLAAAETLEVAATAGCEGVDLPLRDLSSEGVDPRTLRSMMEERGLRGGAFPLPVEWRGDNGRYTHDLKMLPSLARTAEILGLRRTGTWVMPETPLRPESPAACRNHHAEVSALHVERLGTIARVLGTIARVLSGYGIRLGLEVIGVPSARTGAGLPFVHRLADLEQYLGAVWNADLGLGIVADAFHLYAAGETAESALKWGVGRVVWVHVADLPATASGDRGTIRDRERELPGENGAVQSGPLLKILADYGYDGPVTAEPLGACPSLAGLPPVEIARRVSVSLRRVWPDSCKQVATAS